MRAFVIGLLSTVLVGCGTTVSRVIEQDGVYGVMGETEFSQVDLMDALHERADSECSKQSKQVHVVRLAHGSGGIGAFGSKKATTMYFTCI